MGYKMIDGIARIALINGIEVPYHVCSDKQNIRDNKYARWQYLGYGTIHSIDGQPSRFIKSSYHFWNCLWECEGSTDELDT